VTIRAVIPTGDTLTLNSALAETATDWLQPPLRDLETSAGDYQELSGPQEKVHPGKVSAHGLYKNGGSDFWYYLLPNGDLYEFTPFVRQPDPDRGRWLSANWGRSVVQNDPSLLWNAQRIRRCGDSGDQQQSVGRSREHRLQRKFPCG